MTLGMVIILHDLHEQILTATLAQLHIFQSGSFMVHYSEGESFRAMDKL